MAFWEQLFCFTKLSLIIKGSTTLHSFSCSTWWYTKQNVRKFVFKHINNSTFTKHKTGTIKTHLLKILVISCYKSQEKIRETCTPRPCPSPPKTVKTGLQPKKGEKKWLWLGWVGVDIACFKEHQKPFNTIETLYIKKSWDSTEQVSTVSDTSAFIPIWP